MSGAIWTDKNDDGYVDGYIYDGDYFAGVPNGYDPTIGSVASGTTGGMAGAAAGAIIPDVEFMVGATVGAPVEALPGAVWSDQNDDGMVDGYTYDGIYYAVVPIPDAPKQTPSGDGERG